MDKYGKLDEYKKEDGAVDEDKIAREAAGQMIADAIVGEYDDSKSKTSTMLLRNHGTLILVKKYGNITRDTSFVYYIFWFFHPNNPLILEIASTIFCSEFAKQNLT